MLQALWDALSRPVRRPSYSAVAQYVARIAKEDWCQRFNVEDLLIALDPRLDVLATQCLDDLIKLFELDWKTTYGKPRKRPGSMIGGPSLSAVDVVALLDGLERIGFAVDAAELAPQLYERLRAKERVTDQELTTLWYEDTRHKCRPLTLSVEGALPRGSKVLKLKTAARYRCELWVAETGQPYYFFARAPKFRERPAPVEVNCECGVTYRRGDRESSASHRKEHKKREAYLHPKPSEQVAAALLQEGDPVLVRTDSPAWKHREIHLRAQAFRREFGYDFVQWHSATTEPDKTAHGFLFAEPDGTVLGACAFRWREYKDAPPQWDLDWAWVCPSSRRQGVLSRRWAEFRKRFGEFHISGPVSPAMEAFAIRHGDAALLGYEPKQ